MLFSAGEDGIVFIYQLSETKVDPAAEEGMRSLAAGFKLDEGDPGTDWKPLMDPDMANIVMVRKTEMDEWLEKQRWLRARLDETRRSVQAKLNRYKLKYAE